MVLTLSAFLLSTSSSRFPSFLPFLPSYNVPSVASPSFFISSLYFLSQLPRSLKAWVYGRLLAGIACSKPAGGWMFSRECCVLTCGGLITRPEESYRV